tara:strand:- start:139 stop:456 length:318 start_codon:yes stop_codon:yes gene_type:complete
MSDILDTYIKKIHTFQIQEKINNYYHDLMVNKDRLLKSFAVKFEVIRIKLELKKNYINLGKFIFQNYNKEKIVDFSYKNDFFSLNHEIKKNLRYMKKIKNSYKKK